MNLLDLPTELLYEITASAGVFGARALGAACRRLRTISLPYIFKVNHSGIDFCTHSHATLDTEIRT